MRGKAINGQVAFVCKYTEMLELVGAVANCNIDCAAAVIRIVLIFYLLKNSIRVIQYLSEHTNY